MNQEHEYTEQNCLDDFVEAKLRLINKPHNAFIGSLLYDLNVVPNYSVKDAFLDSINQEIQLNPNYFCTLTHEQQATVLAHEVYHYALMHDLRRGHRDPELYQKAADQVVNNLLAAGGFDLPINIEVDTKYAKYSTETVYNIMEADAKNDSDEQSSSNGSSNGNSNGGNGSGGGLSNDLNLNQQANQDAINKAQASITKADAAEELTNGSSMSAGSSGSVFESLFKDIKEGKLNWITILQEYFDELTQGEQSWARLNRRWLQYDIYAPDIMSENHIEKVALAFDVSGSVSQKEIKAFLNEMKLIKNQLDPETMDVVTFNHQIVDIFTIAREDNFDKVTMNIDGGTNLEPVFKHYMKPENQPKFLIVFSDLYCDPITQPTPFETIWICINNERAKTNFGKLIHITSEELINE